MPLTHCLVVYVCVILYANKIHLKPLWTVATRAHALLGHPHRAASQQRQHHSTEKKQRGSRNESRRGMKRSQCGHAGSEGIRNGAGARLLFHYGEEEKAAVFKLRRWRPQAARCEASVTFPLVTQCPRNDLWVPQSPSCVPFKSPLQSVSHTREACVPKTRRIIKRSALIESVL